MTVTHALWLVCEAKVARSEGEGLTAIMAELLQLSGEQELPSAACQRRNIPWLGAGTFRRNRGGDCQDRGGPRSFE